MSGHYETFEAYLHSQSKFKIYTEDWMANDQPLSQPASLISYGKHNTQELRCVADLSTWVHYRNKDFDNHPLTRTPVSTFYLHQEYWEFQLNYFNHADKTLEFLDFLTNAYQNLPFNTSEKQAKLNQLAQWKSSPPENLQLLLQEEAKTYFKTYQEASQPIIQKQRELNTERINELKRKIKNIDLLLSVTAGLFFFYHSALVINENHYVLDLFKLNSNGMMEEAATYYPGANLPFNLCQNPQGLPHWFDPSSVNSIMKTRSILEWPPFQKVVGICDTTFGIFLQQFPTALFLLFGSLPLAGAFLLPISIFINSYFSLYLTNHLIDLRPVGGWISACAPTVFQSLYSQATTAAAQLPFNMSPYSMRMTLGLGMITTGIGAVALAITKHNYSTKLLLREIELLLKNMRARLPQEQPRQAAVA